MHAEAKLSPKDDEKTKTILINFHENKFYLHILLITLALLIAVSIYCYLIKYWAKNISLSFNIRKNEQEKFYINKYIIKIESNDKLKEIDVKNRTCYYFNDIIRIEDLILVVFKN